MRLRFRPIFALTLVGLYAFGGIAHADDYCVSPQATCTAPNTFPSIQPALNAAQVHAGSDRVLIGTGDFAVPSGGLSYSAADPIEVRGAGRGATVLRQANPTPAGSETALLINQAGASGRSLVAELALVVGDSTTGIGGPNYGLAIRDGVDASDIAVSASGVARPRGVGLAGDATLRNSTVDLGYSTSGTEGKIAVTTAAGGDSSSVENSTLRADTGAWAINDSTMNVRRTTVTASTEGLSTAGAKIDAENVVVRLDPPPGGGGIALQAIGQGGVGGIAANHATVTGGNSSSAGLIVNAVTHLAFGTLANSIVRTPGHAMRRMGNPGQNANLSADFNDFLPGAIVDDGGALGGTFSNAHARTDDPRFLGDPDFRLRFDSPLIDARLPPSGTGPADDRDGKPRSVDGDGNGDALLDLGAYEYQRKAPVVTAAATPASALTGDPFGWSVTATDPDGDPLTYGWAWDDGATAATASASHGFAAPGSHTGTATVTDATGLQSSVPATVAVNARPGAGPGAAPDQTPPSFSFVSRKVILTRKNTITVRMMCGAGEPELCGGRLKLASAKRVGAKRRVLKLGSALFGISPGRPKNIRAKVPKGSAKVARRLKKLKIVVVAVATDTAGNKRTVKRNLTLVIARARR